MAFEAATVRMEQRFAQPIRPYLAVDAGAHPSATHPSELAARSP